MPKVSDPPLPNLESDNKDGSIAKQKSPSASFYVINRQGEVVNYDSNRIRIAITKAFLAVEHDVSFDKSQSIHDKVELLVSSITTVLSNEATVKKAINIEYIQDQVEDVLMMANEPKVAKAYILYRQKRHDIRQKASDKATVNQGKTLRVQLSDGSLKPLDYHRLHVIVDDACKDLIDVDGQLIIDQLWHSLFDGMPIADVDKALIMTARTFVEKDPNYSKVTARLLLDQMRSQALSYLNIGNNATYTEMFDLYPCYFKAYLERGVAVGRINKELLTFDLDKITQALQPERDYHFSYLSLQTLYDRYFIHDHGLRFELPQAFFMRVAMGLSLQEEDREARAIEFYDVLSTFDFMCSTPTLFNAGTIRPQLSSCFLTTVSDDLKSIYNGIGNNASLSKFSGGVGNDWTPVRAMGAYIAGTNGKSQGVIPFLNVADATAIAVNQGGKRKGAVCAYLEVWHRDFEDFLELRKNTGDDRRRTHDMNTAAWVNDLFIERVDNNLDWTLFSPDEAPLLHDLYGSDFEQAYLHYEQLAKEGKINNYKTVAAVSLWRKMLSMLFETGHPWITFKDPCNLRSPQQHCGVVHSSNLCTEITLNTSLDEIAVCNLGSINLVNHMDENNQFDIDKLRNTVRLAIRMLDNVISVNYYNVEQARHANLKHRPVGLGVMGFQDCLYLKKIPYASSEAVEFADCYQEYISYFAIEASADLAIERGSYESFSDSLWSRGILPLDSLDLLAEHRKPQYLDVNRDKRLDWDSLRDKVKQGMRHSNVMAIAPTATISNICGVSQSIEPIYQNLYVKSNMSGEFTVINPYLVNDLKALNLWDQVMINDLKYYDGSVQKIERIPGQLKQLYATAFEFSSKWLIMCAARRQKWIDQSISLNLYMATPKGSALDKLYRLAWVSGLKTTYYLRCLGATSVEKATTEAGRLNAVKITTNSNKVCSILDPDCEACQ